MGVMTILSTYVDFKNTKEGRKVDQEPDLPFLIKFTRIKKVNNKGFDARVNLNKSLVKHMKENGINRFKFMFDEKSYNVAIVYCTLQEELLEFEERKTRTDGSIEILDKYISATMIKILEEKKARSIRYKGKFIKDSSAYIFTMGKINKED